MELMTWILIIGGLVALVAGGELLVRGASRVAGAVGVSPLVIGLTVVAFGTSAPELAVSLRAGMMGSADIALANVIGSNIFNILVTAGLCAIIAPLIVDRQLIRFDIPIMVGVSFLAWTMALDGTISTLDGTILAAGLIAYTVYGVRQSRRESAAQREADAAAMDRKGQWQTLALNTLILVAGLVVLVKGADWMVDGATRLARALGVSDVVIGLTIIAIGTSLPEVATSLIATWRGERDLAVGNLIGSNLFNLMMILGVSSVVLPVGLPVDPHLLQIDILVMLGVALITVPIFLKGSITRLEGGFLLACWVLYTAFLVFQATDSPALPALQGVLLTWGLPALVLFVLWSGWQSLMTVPGNGTKEAQ
jgi:cation:H+ antiporter